MALRWIANNSSRVVHIGGQMVLPGAGAFIDEPAPPAADASASSDDQGYIVKGVPVVGSNLSVAFLPGYYPTGSSTYAWFRSNVLGASAIAGATGPSYTLTSQDDGSTIFPFVTNVAYSRIGVVVGQPAPAPAPSTPPAPPALSITASFPAGTVGTAYSGSVTASGGTAPYTYALTAGTLPVGLSLNASTGAITGTPTTATTTGGLVFRVTDAAGATASTSAQSITVAAAALDTRPGWFAAPNTAANTGTAAFVAGRTALSGSANGGKVGTGTLTTTGSNYAWFAIANSGAVTFTDVASGFTGGFTARGTFVDPNSTTWYLYQSDFPASYTTKQVAIS